MLEYEQKISRKDKYSNITNILVWLTVWFWKDEKIDNEY